MTVGAAQVFCHIFGGWGANDSMMQQQVRINMVQMIPTKMTIISASDPKINYLLREPILKAVSTIQSSITHPDMCISPVKFRCVYELLAKTSLGTLHFFHMSRLCNPECGLSLERPGLSDLAFLKGMPIDWVVNVIDTREGSC